MHNQAIAFIAPHLHLVFLYQVVLQEVCLRLAILMQIIRDRTRYLLVSSCGLVIASPCHLNATACIVIALTYIDNASTCIANALICKH
jgi:hypothetical protein